MYPKLLLRKPFVKLSEVTLLFLGNGVDPFCLDFAEEVVSVENGVDSECGGSPPDLISRPV